MRRNFGIKRTDLRQMRQMGIVESEHHRQIIPFRQPDHRIEPLPFAAIDFIVIFFLHKKTHRVETGGARFGEIALNQIQIEQIGTPHRPCAVEITLIIHTECEKRRTVGRQDFRLTGVQRKNGHYASSEKGLFLFSHR